MGSSHRGYFKPINIHVRPSELISKYIKETTGQDQNTSASNPFIKSNLIFAGDNDFVISEDSPDLVYNKRYYTKLNLSDYGDNNISDIPVNGDITLDKGALLRGIKIDPNTFERHLLYSRLVPDDFPDSLPNTSVKSAEQLNYPIKLTVITSDSNDYEKLSGTANISFDSLVDNKYTANLVLNNSLYVSDFSAGIIHTSKDEDDLAPREFGYNCTVSKEGNRADIRIVTDHVHFSDIVKTPTTLSGYGIEDAMTSRDIKSLVNATKSDIIHIVSGKFKEFNDKYEGSFVYKDTLDSNKDLPDGESSNSNEVGDVYRVLETNSNYYWDGTQWVLFSGTDRLYWYGNVWDEPKFETTAKIAWGGSL